MSNVMARSLYAAARRIDQLDGASIAEGATVLAGAKACKALNEISSYRWAFGIDQVMATLSERGPVVLGIPWYDSMYETDAKGRVTVNGSLVGGHCILASGIIPASDPLAIRLGGGDIIEWVNSWGMAYGIRGVGYIRAQDLSMLLKQQGEACIAADVTPRRRVMSVWDSIRRSAPVERMMREFRG